MKNIKIATFSSIRMTLSSSLRTKFRWLTMLFCLAGLQVATLDQAKAVPVQFGANFYEFIDVTDPLSGINNSFGTAQTAAAALSFGGVSGHLATITSQAENDFLFGLLLGSSPTAFTGAWLGGKAPAGWLVGPETGNTFNPIFANFFGTEPNNAGFIYMNIGSLNPGGSTSTGQWFDDSLANGSAQGVPSAADPVTGYFVEFENVSAVPLPAALPLYGTGLAIMGFIGWRRRQRAA